MAIPSEALSRLPQYNDGVYNASTNPYGMDNAGYIVNFPLAATDIATVANYMAEAAETVTDIGPEIAALGALSTELQLLAPLAANGNIAALYAIRTQMTTLAGIAANITSVAGNSANINAAVANAANINSVAAAIGNINSVAAGLSNIASVLSNITAINNVAGKLTEITTVSGVATAVSAVATNIANVNTVAGASSAITTVAGVAGNVTTVAGVATQLASVASNAGAIGTVGDNIAAVNAASNNIASIIAASGNATTASNAATAAQTAAAAAKRTALFMEFDSGTGDTNPGTGCWRLNNGAIGAATQMFVSTTAKSGGDIADWLDTWDDSSNPGNRGEITLIDASNSGNWLKVFVTGANTVASGYYKIAISYVDHAGSLVDAAEFSVEFSRAGNIGASGAGTGTVQTSGTVADQRLAIFDGTTGNFIKDGGKAVADLATSAQGAKADSALQPAAVGVSIQGYDATLAALAAITTSANKLIYATGSDAFSTTDLSAFARTLLDDADAAAMRSTLGVVIGSNVQAYNALLAAIAGLTGAADRLPYLTGTDTAALATFTAFARQLLDDVDAAAMRATLGLGTAAVAATGDFAAASHVSSGGAAHAAATTSVAGFMSSTDKSKLDGVASGATANATNAELRDRSTHTGTQAISTVTGLQTALDGKEAANANIAKVNTAQTWSGAQKFGRLAGAIATTSGTSLDNTNGNEHTRTVAANTTFTVAGVPSSGDAFHVRLLLTYTSGTITWFSGVNWVGGTAPTFTGGKKYEIIFSTENGGTTWRAASGEYAA